MASIKMEPAIGIYLGTEYSCVGVWHDGRVEIIPNDQGNMTTPSCVAFTPDTELIGEAAEIQADKNPTNTIFDMNCLIGRSFSDPTVQSNRIRWPFNVIEGAGDKPKIVVQYRGEEKQFYPEELSSMILAKMKKIAENFLDCIVRDALVIVRAYFNDSQRRAMRNAGRIAGLNVMYIMDESVMMDYCTPQMVALREIGNANQERVDLQRELSETQKLTQKLMSERDETKRLTQQLMFERDVATKLSEVAQKQLMCERKDTKKLSEATKKHTKQLMSERDNARKLSEVAQKQLMSERDDARKLSEATKKHTNQLMSERNDARKLLEAAQKQLLSERDDTRKLSEMAQKQLMCERDDTIKLSEMAQKQLMCERDDAIKQLLSERDDARIHSEAAQKLTEQLMFERDDARKHSEATQKLTEQLMSERDYAKKYSEAAQKLTEQLMSERDDAKKHSQVAQKLTEQLMSERDEAKKHSEAAQKLKEQLMSERDDAKKHSEVAQKLIEQLISERDYDIKQVEELRWLTEQQALGRKCVGCFSGYSYSELQNMTDNFHESFKLGEGGYGKVYKGILHNSTTIAIKILNQGSSQGAKEFHQEVEVLSKLQHPNLVKLIGACAENHALIYEYLPNGSLEDRLRCKDNTLPLSWQARVRIAFEICSALSFLHCSKPHGIVHGDLKPDNVLLDLNNVSKLGDFGLCRQLNRTTNASQPFHITDCLKGTFGYIDPEYFTTGKMTPRNDVYSFGIMLLQLVTCKDPRGIRQSVEEAHRKGTLKALIDASAGPWPFKKAEKMISLGLRCSDIMSINRPDLLTVVLKEMKSMADVASASQSSSWIASLFRR